ncbi:hypothetical protein BCR34DRAFT_453291, partial [Clohesyomyces aquaticus]
LDYNNRGPITGKRREEFEELRQNHVPRYLFRAWTPGSGGGERVSINTTTEIVPPAIRRNRNLDLYSMTETELYNMTSGHIRGEPLPITAFSSWGASLQLVLCYAQFLEDRNGSAHIAIMDTQAVDGVLAWHVPHLHKYEQPQVANHEFLVFGHIHGPGYKAIPLHNFPGWRTMIQDPKKKGRDWWGHHRRVVAFSKRAQRVTQEDLEIINSAAAKFEDLSMPVAIALLNIRPRPWRHRSPTQEEMDMILQGLHSITIPAEELVQSQWLGPGMIDTKNFPDVQQHLDFLRAVAEYIT